MSVPSSFHNPPKRSATPFFLQSHVKRKVPSLLPTSLRPNVQPLPSSASVRPTRWPLCPHVLTIVYIFSTSALMYLAVLILSAVCLIFVSISYFVYLRSHKCLQLCRKPRRLRTSIMIIIIKAVILSLSLNCWQYGLFKRRLLPLIDRCPLYVPKALKSVAKRPIAFFPRNAIESWGAEDAKRASYQSQIVLIMHDIEDIAQYVL